MNSNDKTGRVLSIEQDASFSVPRNPRLELISNKISIKDSSS